jgi:hypothetical protein
MVTRWARLVTQRRLTAFILAGSTMNGRQGSDDLALNRKAMQSSTDGDAVASRAIDGLTAPWAFANSFSKTTQMKFAWWMVDLEACCPPALLPGCRPF